MLKKVTFSTVSAVFLALPTASFAQSDGETTEPKPKAAPRVVFEIPSESVNDEPIKIKRLSIYDPTPEQVRDKALLDAIRADVIKGHEARDAGDAKTALNHYQTALEKLEKTLLEINSYDARFGIGMVAPAIADTYAELGDARAKPAAKRVARWHKCGLMAAAGEPTAHFDPELCGDTLTFELFRASGA
ncbi:hypothetical protein [Amylibacter sp. IMCC11727]|uniref:hypothetical protein n=1 Tax=Amylibacter sp. IMCC11727 TaxID=3039851 RepID=UPI00244DCAA9|nr:hypothetical protein [Amylibacter sp. IMCC11727]WGI23065.1 hypothetical protein QBD29_06485 [Amylibacter sp. IMCC11727]